jgi:hypothetical protein
MNRRFEPVMARDFVFDIITFSFLLLASVSINLPKHLCAFVWY